LKLPLKTICRRRRGGQKRNDKNASLVKAINNLSKIMATVAERLAAVESAIDEGSSELVAEIAKLREQIGAGITPEAEATLVRLEAKATALKDIIPNEGQA
jgi:ABC-type transporter Mla subunit MlaD